MERQIWSLKELFGDFERKTIGQKIECPVYPQLSLSKHTNITFDLTPFRQYRPIKLCCRFFEILNIENFVRPSISTICLYRF
jgi:hypothetical protein